MQIFSCYNNPTYTGSISLDEYVDRIASNDSIIYDKRSDQYIELKGNSPIVAINASFNKKASYENFLKSTGYIFLDVDENVSKEFFALDFVAMASLSLSSTGTHYIGRLDQSVTNWLDANPRQFKSLYNYISKTYFNNSLDANSNKITQYTVIPADRNVLYKQAAGLVIEQEVLDRITIDSLFKSKKTNAITKIARPEPRPRVQDDMARLKIEAAKRYVLKETLPDFHFEDVNVPIFKECFFFISNLYKYQQRIKYHTARAKQQGKKLTGTEGKVGTGKRKKTLYVEAGIYLSLNPWIGLDELTQIFTRWCERSAIIDTDFNYAVITDKVREVYENYHADNNAFAPFKKRKIFHLHSASSLSRDEKMRLYYAGLSDFLNKANEYKDKIDELLADLDGIPWKISYKDIGHALNCTDRTIKKYITTEQKERIEKHNKEYNLPYDTYYNIKSAVDYLIESNEDVTFKAIHTLTNLSVSYLKKVQKKYHIVSYQGKHAKKQHNAPPSPASVPPSAKNCTFLEIDSCIKDLIEKKSIITQTVVADLTGLSIRTVKDYWKSFKPVVTAYKEKLKEMPRAVADAGATMPIIPVVAIRTHESMSKLQAYQLLEEVRNPPGTWIKR